MKNVAAIVCGMIMMIAAVTLLCIFHNMVFPCVVLFIIGFMALGDGMDAEDKS
jgi:hypothetical protein